MFIKPVMFIISENLKSFNDNRCLFKYLTLESQILN